MEDQSAPIPDDKTSELGGNIIKCARSTAAVETTPAVLLNEEAGKELTSARMWPVLLAPARGCAYGIEVRPSSPTVDEFHSEREKQNVPVFLHSKIIRDGPFYL